MNECGDTIEDRDPEDWATLICTKPAGHRSAHGDGRGAIWTDGEHWGEDPIRG